MKTLAAVLVAVAALLGCSEGGLTDNLRDSAANRSIGSTTGCTITEKALVESAY